MSASANVTVPPPSSLSLSIDSAAARDHCLEGTPSPKRQSGSALIPARRAAARMVSRATSVSALHASKRVPSAAIIKRNVNGLITGRGAKMLIARLTCDDAERINACSNLRFSASLSDIAVTDTLPASIEILERGSNRSAFIPNSIAAAQPSGVGYFALSSKSLTCSFGTSFATSSRIFSLESVLGMRPIKEMPLSLRRISIEKRGGAKASRSATSV